MKYHIVRLTLRKSEATVLLIYDKKTRLLSGHFFPNKQFEKQQILEMIDDAFPPDFEAIGDYSIKMKNRIDYLLLDKMNNQEELTEIQTTLNI